MAKTETKPEIKYESIDELCLDSKNPRLGRRYARRNLSQPKVLELMRDWSLEELAVSFLENDFWPQEALVVVKEQVQGKKRLVVIEGNRRLAALRFLKGAIDGDPASRKWREIAESASPPSTLFTRVPYMEKRSRKEAEAFIGFRHVTGIKPWAPAEKAEYIAHLVDSGLSYVEVMRRIGSKVDPVRRNYISYRILLQMENLEEDVSLEHVEEKFSVMFLSLREAGTQRFLQIDIKADPKVAQRPVPPHHLDNLADFAIWLFGTEARAPLFTDSRNVTKFGRVLQSDVAVEYLRSSEEPSFDVAVQKAAADEPDIMFRIGRATDDLEQALGRVHLYVDSPEIIKAVDRFGRGAIELIKKFPSLSNELLGNGGE